MLSVTHQLYFVVLSRPNGQVFSALVSNILEREGIDRDISHALRLDFDADVYEAIAVYRKIHLIWVSYSATSSSKSFCAQGSTTYVGVDSAVDVCAVTFDSKDLLIGPTVIRKGDF